MKKNITEEIAVLNKVLPVVVRVHGKEHLELKDVLDAYERFKVSFENGKGESELEEIRELTDHYTLPSDACEAYAKVYDAFKSIDE